MTDTFRRTAALAAAGSIVFTITFALFVRESYRWALFASGLVAVPAFEVGVAARLRDVT